jgi:tetratricopeptide (TPR) repeat protein
MRARNLLAVSIVLGTLAAAVPFLPALAAGPSGAGAAKPAAGGKGQADFMQAINDGSVKYVGKELPEAVELFRKAVQIQPRNPLGYYLLGEALLGSGSLPDAETAWLQGEQVAEAGPPSVQAKLLFVLADLRERQGRWDDALIAWKRYADFASQSHDAGAYPQSAEARIRDIEAMQKQDKDYVIVRKRIRDEDGGALGKMPPPEKK